MHIQTIVHPLKKENASNRVASKARHSPAFSMKWLKIKQFGMQKWMRDSELRFFFLFLAICRHPLVSCRVEDFILSYGVSYCFRCIFSICLIISQIPKEHGAVEKEFSSICHFQHWTSQQKKNTHTHPRKWKTSFIPNEWKKVNCKRQVVGVEWNFRNTSTCKH